MVRSLVGFAIFAAAVLLGLRLLGFVLSLVGTLLWLAFLGFVFYLVLRIFSPATADRLKEKIRGSR